VIVDIKLALESDQDFKSNFVEAPIFHSPSRLWLEHKSTTLSGGMIQRSCGKVDCVVEGCPQDVYLVSQKKMRGTIESEIKLVLDEYDTDKHLGNRGGKRFRQLMEEKGMTILLPGVVPGFALRNRKWGK
jgi:hypothetical protein